jgi:AraC-like DNA-binding protein
MILNHDRLSGLTLFAAPPALHQHDRHAHASLAIIMLTEGEKSYHVERKNRKVHAGQIAIANPGELHGCEYVGDQPWAHRTWYLSPELLSMLSVEIGFKRNAEVTEHVIDCPQTTEFLMRAHYASNAGNELDREAVAVEAMSMFLTRFGAERVRNEPLLSTAIEARVSLYVELLRNNTEAPLSLSLLASHAGVGRFQVIRDFQQTLRMSPGDYLRYLRLSKARTLLRGGASLVDASLAAGYSDQSHFSRVFKRVFGYSPSHFLATIGRTKRTSLH